MRLFRALLHLYPASFRVEYGDELAAVFAERRREATGPLARTWLWLETLADVVSIAVRVHADVLRQDLAFTARTLRRSPGFALTATAVAALGVGATTASFSIADHVLFRPLPFTEPDRLVKLWQDQSSRGYSRAELSPGNYRDWKRMSGSFESMGAYRIWPYNLGGEGEPERVEAASFTAEIFPLLGVPPALGRVFAPEDDRPEAPATAVLSHGLWQARFAGDAGVIGRKILLDGAPHVVIG